jgi:hypothetical protein
VTLPELVGIVLGLISTVLAVVALRDGRVSSAKLDASNRKLDASNHKLDTLVHALKTSPDLEVRTDPLSGLVTSVGTPYRAW